MARRGWGSARRTPYKGIVYASKTEAVYAQRLDLMKKAGEIRDWDRQVKIPLVVDGKHVCNMLADFRVWTKDGRVEYHETKGFASAVWKLKAKLLAALYPDLVYKVIPAKEVLAR